jgi:uncharacterized membrane protein YcjF (UPF0283 family)
MLQDLSMGEKKPHDEPLDHRRLLLKAVVELLALLGGAAALAEYSTPISNAIKSIRSESLALPVVAVGYYAIRMMVEILQREFRRGIESLRTEPRIDREDKTDGVSTSAAGSTDETEIA